MRRGGEKLTLKARLAMIEPVVSSVVGGMRLAIKPGDSPFGGNKLGFTYRSRTWGKSK